MCSGVSRFGKVFCFKGTCLYVYKCKMFIYAGEYVGALPLEQKGLSFVMFLRSWGS